MGETPGLPAEAGVDMEDSHCRNSKDDPDRHADDGKNEIVPPKAITFFANVDHGKSLA